MTPSEHKQIAEVNQQWRNMNKPPDSVIEWARARFNKLDGGIVALGRELECDHDISASYGAWARHEISMLVAERDELQRWLKSIEVTSNRARIGICDNYVLIEPMEKRQPKGDQ